MDVAMVVKGCFRFFYNLYNTSLGECLHNCMIRNRHFRRIRSGQHLDHSNIDREYIEFPTLRIKIVPLAKTNYSYFLQDLPSGMLAVVDPGDPDYLAHIADTVFKQPISFAFVTHKHWDHSAGVTALKARYPGLRVISHSKEKLAEATERLNDRDFVKLGTTTVTLLHTPGHTEGSVCYYIFQEEYQPILFTGDTLFLGGMGAFFEGSARAILSTIEKLKTLPDETLIFPGHEYSEYTLRFARYIDGKNSSALAKGRWVFRRRNRYFCTIPMTMKEEKSYNPFLRLGTEAVQEKTSTHTELAALLGLMKLRITKRSEYKRTPLSTALP
jgi:hydroxyacylglutathione hydrolase